MGTKQLECKCSDRKKQKQNQKKHAAFLSLSLRQKDKGSEEQDNVTCFDMQVTYHFYLFIYYLSIIICPLHGSYYSDRF